MQVQTMGEAAATDDRSDLVRWPEASAGDGSVDAVEVHRLRSRLAARAYLFDDPDAYLAGVDEVLTALTRPARQGHRAHTA